MNSVSRRSARVLCVLAVLIGLFGMHGMAAADAGGCHQLPGMTAAPPAYVMTPMAAHLAAPTMAGASCEFVAPTGWPPLALALLAIVAAVVRSGSGRRHAPWIGGRSPPDSGTFLLRRVCVSRT